jgi:hypothetical protein
MSDFVSHPESLFTLRCGSAAGLRACGLSAENGCFYFDFAIALLTATGTFDFEITIMLSEL